MAWNLCRDGYQSEWDRSDDEKDEWEEGSGYILYGKTYITALLTFPKTMN